MMQNELLKRRLIYFGLVTILVLLLIYIFIIATKKPWEAGGRLVLAVRTVPGLTSEMSLGLGMDNLVLLTEDGDERRVTILSKRFMLQPGSSNLEVLLDVAVPVGNYSGIAFSLTSPELRNAWQEDTAPTPISLGGEFVSLSSSFHIEKDKTSSVVLSFETLSALYEKEGKELYLPVIQVETRFDSALTTSESGVVSIEGGAIERSATYGMGWDGMMHYNVRASRNESSDTTQDTTEQTPPPIETATSTEIGGEETSSSTEEADLTEGEEEHTSTSTSEEETTQL